MRLNLKFASLAVLAVGTLFSCNNDDSISVTSVTMSVEERSIAVGEVVTIKATVSPANADDVSVEWYSSDETVVQMDSCYATAISVGEATVTVVTVDGQYTATCEVTVTAFPDDPTSLNDEGTANCYLVESTGIYLFDATVRGNGATTSGLDAPSSLAPASVELLWETDTCVVSNVWYYDGEICFKVSNHGNALIAAKNSGGEIIWSWHVWYPEDEPYAFTASNGYEIMNMNLGATEAGYIGMEESGSYGMLYQWGRKDPFPSSPELTGDDETVALLYDMDTTYVYLSSSSYSSTTSNTIEYSIANPTTVISNYSQASSTGDWLALGSGNDALWGNPSGNEADENGAYGVNTGEKSFYDPCPVGWKVPPADAFETFSLVVGESTDYNDFNVFDREGDGKIDADDFDCGWLFNINGAMNCFPASGRYDGADALLYGSVCGLWGDYWCNAPGDSESEGMGFSGLSFTAESISTASAAARANAFSIRCVKE